MKNKLDLTKKYRIRGAGLDFRVVDTKSQRTNSEGKAYPLIVEIWPLTEGPRRGNLFYLDEYGRVTDNGTPHIYDLLPEPELVPWDFEDVFKLKLLDRLYRHNNWAEKCVSKPVGTDSTGMFEFFLAGSTVNYSMQEMFVSWWCSSDGGNTWQPCGKTE